MSPSPSPLPSVGLSGLALYVPRPKVSLEDWCGWTGESWDKIAAVVGRSFRMPAPHESLYTMAANAVLRLIEQYDVDPRDVGFFALGTESSTDNAAGAVIVRGMVDRALELRGKPRLSRACEVPETKHACLGGIYAMKGALRYLALDGRGRKAIVVAGDIAEYERGSSGEPTQGAGAVAMLLEESPALLRVDLARGGSSSDFRVVDFRKPFARHFAEGYATRTERLADFPVFNGKYSTFCYQDAVVHAARAMFERQPAPAPHLFYEGLAAIFMHRPYHHMPQSGLTWMLVAALAATPEGRTALAPLATEIGVPLDGVVRELEGAPDLFERAMTRGAGGDPYPQASALVKAARKLAPVERVLKQKMRLGAETMKDLGNLYTAALPAWLAAGLEQAASEKALRAGDAILAVGYGSGDAAEVIPMSLAPDWERAAAKIGFATALEGAVPLTREQYERRHDGLPVVLDCTPEREFVVDRVGDRVSGDLQDVGIEYYRWVGAADAE